MSNSVLIVTQYFYPETFRINTIAKLLVLKGWSVTVLTGCPNYPDGESFEGYSSLNISSELHSDGFTIHRVPIITRGKGSSIRLFFNYLSYIFCGVMFGGYALRRAKFDLVFVYAPSPIFQSLVGIYFKYLRGIPVITWVQDLWPECIEFTGRFKNKTILNFIANIVNWTYRQNDLLLTQSKSFITSVTFRAGSVPVQYFPNPGDEDSNLVHSKLDISAEKFFLTQGFNVVFAGNLGTVQSLPTIVAAAEILQNNRNIRFVLVGSGSLSTWLKNQIEIKQLNNIVLAGRYPPCDMPAIFNQASALLISLNRDPVLNQTVPAKLQSYLGAGKPIIASLDGEGAQIVLDSEAGFACPAEDPIALAEVVLKLSDLSQEQLNTMGSSGKNYFQVHFEPSMLVDKLISIFMETISRNLTKRNYE